MITAPCRSNGVGAAGCSRGPVSLTTYAITKLAHAGKNVRRRGVVCAKLMEGASQLLNDRDRARVLAQGGEHAPIRARDLLAFRDITSYYGAGSRDPDQVVTKGI